MSTLERFTTVEERAAALQRVVALINDKGGVGKTTLAVNLAGQYAAAGYRTLLIDLNRQANVADDLGYRNVEGIDDQGAGLLGALLLHQPLVPVAGARENLWVIPGGVKLGDLTAMISSRANTEGRDAFLALALALAPIAHQFDVILIDSPPENTTLVDLVLAAARWVIMPTRSDSGGVVGMRLVAERFKLAREINPALGLLGVVLFASGTQSTAIRAEVSAEVASAFGGQSPMLNTTIRYSERVARDARRLGRLAHELEVDAAAQPAFWQALREGKKGPRFSAATASVSADFQALAGEVLDALTAAEEEAEAMAVSA